MHEMHELLARHADADEEVPMMSREQLQELMHSVLFGDLLASIMALLDVKHHQARRVCSAWHAEWWATDTVCRGLRRQVSPPVLMPHDTHVNDIIPLDDERLCLASTRGMGAGAGADGMRVIVNMPQFSTRAPTASRSPCTAVTNLRAASQRATAASSAVAVTFDRIG